MNFPMIRHILLTYCFPVKLSNNRLIHRLPFPPGKQVKYRLKPWRS